MGWGSGGWGWGLNAVTKVQNSMKSEVTVCDRQDLGDWRVTAQVRHWSRGERKGALFTLVQVPLKKILLQDNFFATVQYQDEFFRTVVFAAQVGLRTVLLCDKYTLGSNKMASV